MSYASSEMYRFRKWRNRLRLSLLFISLFLLAYHSVYAFTIDDARRNGLAWLIKNQHGDKMPSNFDLQIQATNAVVEAMQIGGLSKLPQFAQAVTCVSNAQGDNIDAKAWQSIQLDFLGRNVQLVADIAAAQNNFISKKSRAVEQGAFALWGNQQADRANIIDANLAVNTLRESNYSYAGNITNWFVTQQQTNGSWQNDAFVTVPVLASFPSAVSGELTDNDNDVVPDVIETQLSMTVGVDDAEGKLSGDGVGTVSETFISFSQQTTLHKSFIYKINFSGGTGTITFAFRSGALPPGLSMSSSGVISGIPSIAGSFAFDYSVSDSTGKSGTVLGRIDVRDPTQPDPNKVLKHKYLPAILNLLLSP